jgi:hypothetical protein
LISCSEGTVDLVYHVSAEEVHLLPGETVILELEVKAPSEIPMDSVIHISAPNQEKPVVDCHYDFKGEGVWRTVRMSAVVPSGPITSLDVAVRTRANKQTEAFVRRASVTLVPPI